MNGEFLEFSDNTLTFISEIPKDVGAEIDYELRLPEGILLQSLLLRGIVIKCRYANNNGFTGYLLEMTVSNLSEENKLILEAYVDYLKREEELNRITIDHKALQEAFENVGEKFAELYKESMLLLRNLRGSNTIH